MRLDEQQKVRRSSRLILLSVCIGQTIVGLDQRAITVALPTLTDNFSYGVYNDPMDHSNLRPGARRLDDRRQRQGDCLGEFTPAGTGSRLGTDLDCISHRLFDRTIARRLSHRHHRLALDFLHQLALQSLRRLSRMESYSRNASERISRHRHSRCDLAAPDQWSFYLRYRSAAAHWLAASGVSADPVF